MHLLAVARCLPEAEILVIYPIILHGLGPLKRLLLLLCLRL